MLGIIGIIRYFSFVEFLNMEGPLHVDWHCRVYRMLVWYVNSQSVVMKKA